MKKIINKESGKCYVIRSKDGRHSQKVEEVVIPLMEECFTDLHIGEDTEGNFVIVLENEDSRTLKMAQDFYMYCSIGVMHFIK